MGQTRGWREYLSGSFQILSWIACLIWSLCFLSLWPHFLPILFSLQIQFPFVLFHWSILDYYVSWLQSAGNAAFRSGKHVEAVEHYTAAIYGSMESRPFAAICVCNRAAAHQAMGQVTDAISDCSLAIALDETYAKVQLASLFFDLWLS